MRSLKSEPFPAREEWVLEAFLEGPEYVVRVNDKEFYRTPTTRTSMSGLWLQAGWNQVRFSDVKLRRKK